MIKLIVDLENLKTIGNILLLGSIILNAVWVIRVVDPIYKLLALLGVFLLTGISWFNLDAEFLGFALIILYVGAVMVLFLITFMLLNLTPKVEGKAAALHNNILTKIGILIYKMAACILVLGLLAIFIYVCKDYMFSVTSNANNNIEILTKHLFNNYILLFGSAGLTLLAAMLVVTLIMPISIEDASQSSTKNQSIFRKNTIKLLDLT